MSICLTTAGVLTDMLRLCLLMHTRGTHCRPLCFPKSSLSQPLRVSCMCHSSATNQGQVHPDSRHLQAPKHSHSSQAPALLLCPLQPSHPGSQASHPQLPHLACQRPPRPAAHHALTRPCPQSRKCNSWVLRCPPAIPSLPWRFHKQAEGTQQKPLLQLRHMQQLAHLQPAQLQPAPLSCLVLSWQTWHARAQGCWTC